MASTGPDPLIKRAFEWLGIVGGFLFLLWVLFVLAMMFRPLSYFVLLGLASLLLLYLSIYYYNKHAS